MVDGKPVWEAPKVERVKTVLDTDNEFDAGSKINLSSLTPAQTQNLEMLGKVWGFVKYHHPAVTAGKHNWEYELVRVMPKVLAADNRDAADAAVGIGFVAWERFLIAATTARNFPTKICSSHRICAG